MNNPELAMIFQDMASILELKDIEWKPQAYRRAARSLEILKEDVADVYKETGLKGLEEIPGVGESIAKKIVEYLKKGRIKEYEKLKRSIPHPVAEMMRVPGMGPKKAKLLYNKLHIKSIKQLERAAKEGKLEKLRTFKKKTEENILKGIQILRGTKDRYALNEVLPLANRIVKKLEKVEGVKKVYLAGSARRKKPTVGDLDILVISKNHTEAIDKFTKLPEVKSVQAKGHTKATVRLKNGMQADLRLLPENSLGAALQYFTGSKDHSVKLRMIAIKKGYKLSEYGLFSRKTGKRIPAKTEKDLYSKLGLRYIPPEKRLGKDETEKYAKK